MVNNSFPLEILALSPSTPLCIAWKQIISETPQFLDCAEFELELWR